MRRPRIESLSPTRAIVDGQELLLFAGTNMLGLAQHPDVVEAAREELGRCGLSATAARETSGNFAVHEQLEEALARFLGCQSALLISDGWLANLALAQAYQGELRTSLVDADSHASVHEAAHLASERVHDFGSGNSVRAHALIDRFGSEHLAVWTDGVFPLLGRYADLGNLLRPLSPTGLLVVDDSYGLGVLGPGGRGTAAAHGISDVRLVITASLAKALGGAGGVIAGSGITVDRIRRQSQAYRGTTAMAPHVAAGVHAALMVLEREPGRVDQLHVNASAVFRMLGRLGHKPPGHGLPALPIPIKDEEQGRALTARLRTAGFFVPWIDYPGSGGGCLRIAVSSEHTKEDIEALEQALATHLA